MNFYRRMGRPVNTCALALLMGAMVGCASSAPSKGLEIRHIEPTAPVDSGYRSGPEYTAASGRVCRRVVSDSGATLVQVSCRGSGGAWVLGRELGSPSPVGVTATLAVLTELETRVPVVDPDVEITVVREALAPQETLWAFSRRMTGDASNAWKIAEVNRIDNAGMIAAGTTLEVPVDLLDVQ